MAVSLTNCWSWERQCHETIAWQDRGQCESLTYYWSYDSRCWIRQHKKRKCHSQTVGHVMRVWQKKRVIAHLLLDMGSDARSP